MIDNRPMLLIGASGMIGTAVSALLSEHGFSVRVFVREGMTVAAYFAEGKYELATGNLITGEGLAEAISGVQAVLYFASTSVPATSANNPAIDFAASVPPLANVLNAMAAHNIGARFIFPSSGGAIYGSCSFAASESTPIRPLSAYALGKAVAEQTIRFYDDVFNIRSDILRISNAYGNALPRTTPQGVIDRFLDDAISETSSEVWGSLDIERDYVFVDDVAHAVLRAVSKPGRPSSIFNVGQSQSHSLADVLEIIARVTNNRHRYKVVPNQYQGVRRSALDCSAIHQTLGWSPSFTLDEGIETAWKLKTHR